MDRVKIYVRGGRGGRGSSSRKRLSSFKFINTGGDGGKGGDVYICVNRNLFDLSHFLGKREFIASRGQDGSSNNKKGKDGLPLFLEVPLGTVVKDASSQIIKDLIKEEERILITKGGRGGKGNYRRRVSFPPQEGEGKELILDFLIPADVAIIGRTNTGKSTLVSQLTNLKVPVSKFPFTTRFPVWGVVERGFKVFTILELPAIIGESREVPKNTQFLKHLKRPEVLVFLLDSQRKNYSLEVELLRRIIKEFNPSFLENKKTLVVINKIDEFTPSEKEGLLISAKNGKGLDLFLDEVFKFLG